MAMNKETRASAEGAAERHNSNSRPTLPATAPGIRSAEGHSVSHEAGHRARPRLASALTIADSRRGLESPTTAGVEGEGQASRPLGSGSVPRLHGTAEASTARWRWKFGLSLSQAEWKRAPIRRRIWISRAVLLGILIVQAMLSLQLQNTAFQDEALYLYAGHLQLDHLLRGGPMRPSTEFESSPVKSPTRTSRRPAFSAGTRSSSGEAGTLQSRPTSTPTKRARTGVSSCGSARPWSGTSSP